MDQTRVFPHWANAAVWSFTALAFGTAVVWSPFPPDNRMDIHEPTQVSVPYFDQVLFDPHTTSATSFNNGIPTEIGLREAPSPTEAIADTLQGLQNSTTGDIVRAIHERSGLTWQQLAKALGVSRRTLHFWANGGSMSARHSELLSSFETLVGTYNQEDPGSTRLALLRSQADGISAFDRFRIHRDQNVPPINRPVLSAAELLSTR